MLPQIRYRYCDRSERAESSQKGLANKTRLKILCSISQGELNVRDLEARLGIREQSDEIPASKAAQ